MFVRKIFFRKIFFISVILFPFILFSQNIVGFIHITSEPSGAKVYLDGHYIGVTPIEQNAVPIGQHSLEVRYKNFVSQTMKIHIRENELWSKHIILVKKKGFKVVNPELDQANQETGKLTIITNPPGAEVTMDNITVKKRKTPLMLTELGAGEHYVKLAFDNLGTDEPFIIEKTVYIKGGKTNLLNIDIKNYTGKLTVLTQPPKAEVYLDDKIFPTASTPATIDYLRPGLHKVKIRKYLNTPLNDYFVLDTTVTLIAKKTKLLNIDFDNLIGVGYLTVKSNMSGKEVEINEARFNKKFTFSIPFAQKTLYNSNAYQLKWEKEKNRLSTLNFSIYKNRTTQIYIPFFKPLKPYKTVEDHPDYQSEEDYIASHFTPLPEYIKIKKSRIGYLSAKEKTTLQMSIFFGSIFIWPALKLLSQPKAIFSSVQFFGLSSMIISIPVASIWAIIKTVKKNTITYYEKHPNNFNIAKNKKKKEEIRREYLKKYENWKKEIDEENLSIKKINMGVEQYNNSLPQPSVRYK